MLRRGQHLMRMLRNERRPEPALMAEASRRLQVLVQQAYHRVPFYRHLYEEHGVDCAGFRGLPDLGRLPIIDKQMLANAGADAEAIDAPDGCVTISTSGSSGKVYAFRVDPDFNAWRKAQYLRPYLTNGRRLTDKVLRLTAFPTARVPWFAGLGVLREAQFGCATDPAEIVDHWRRLGPDLLQGYPSALRVLAHHCLQRGIRLDPAPRRVFADSELLTSDTRSLLQRAFGCPVVDIFGTYETDNIAYQCERGDGYHVAVDSVVLEVLRDGRPVEPGKSGELVVTVLRNNTTPLIRYNLRDVVALATEPCGCGRTFPTLRVLAGRSDDQLVLPGRRKRSPLALIGRLDELGEALREFQVEQTGIDRFVVRIVPAHAPDVDLRQRVSSAVLDEVPGASVDVVIQDEIRRAPSGKLRVFTSIVRADAP